MSPQTHYYWAYSLAAALQLVAYSETLDEAKKVARTYLAELADFSTGLPGVSDEIRQQWQLAAYKEGEKKLQRWQLAQSKEVSK